MENKEKCYQLLIQQLTIVSLYWEEVDHVTREFYINRILDEMLKIRKSKKNDK
jgi:hypothetical protein